ncbi:hypothetical protein DPMN_000295 [Dreissena polymorpha]|uniref:Uncharacterized protein n=1 Tax=Dreissena polymorpha TaxID=45954 RepID=A0A9D4RRY3_DREPO|nr:hypothetical protein DPMN_000295 [Dreissena polymorpha]
MLSVVLPPIDNTPTPLVVDCFRFKPRQARNEGKFASLRFDKLVFDGDSTTRPAHRELSPNHGARQDGQSETSRNADRQHSGQHGLRHVANNVSRDHGAEEDSQSETDFHSQGEAGNGID